MLWKSKGTDFGFSWLTSGRGSPSPSIQQRIRRMLQTKAQQQWNTLLGSHKCHVWQWRETSCEDILQEGSIHACKYTHWHAWEYKGCNPVYPWCLILVVTLLCVLELKLGCTADLTCLLIYLTCWFCSHSPFCAFPPDRIHTCGVMYVCRGYSRTSAGQLYGCGACLCVYFSLWDCYSCDVTLVLWISHLYWMTHP